MKVFVDRHHRPTDVAVNCLERYHADGFQAIPWMTRLYSCQGRYPNSDKSKHLIRLKESLA